MEIIAFIGTIAAPKNDKKGMRRFEIVWSHLPQYQKSWCADGFTDPPLIYSGMLLIIFPM